MHGSSSKTAGASASGLSLALLRGLLAGGWLALCEIALVVGFDRALFLTDAQLGRHALLALLALPVAAAGVAFACALPLSLLSQVRGGTQLGPRALGVAAGVLGLPPVLVILLELGTGRRARALADQKWPVALAAVVSVVAIAWVVSRVVARARSGSPARAQVLALLCASVACLALDAQLLRRLYPALHWAFAAGALGSALAASYLLLGSARARLGKLAWPLAALLVVALPFAFERATAVSSVRMAVEVAAPLSSKLLWLGGAAFGDRREPAKAKRPPTASAAVSGQAASSAGLDLRGRDVLLVTIDALRADRLRAYGGSGVTPELDALAAQSRVFLRAYTPTPHTSYAIASLMTGKPLFLLRALSEDLRSHVTLPELLRRHGYRTAGFYPPAIFFVDSERFSAIADRHLGFEYVKAMYAKAALRPKQLDAYLREVTFGHPVFAWVHLFEPHEPYDPDPPFARGDAPVERYDGEVAAADAAVGELVRVFRRARPESIVIVSADHGEEFGEHGGHHHGTTLFDEQVRVPLLWSTPGSVEPGTSEVPVELYDLPTTLLSALGVPRDVRMRGDDLSPLLARPPGEAAGAPRYAFAALDSMLMTTDGRWKHLCATHSGVCQLFDLREDPKERVDVTSAQPDVASELRAAWDELVASVPKIEALDLSGRAWPEALTRARLFDRSVAPALIGLLSSPRAEVRAEAALALADLSAQEARTVLAGLLEREPDSEARAQMAIAALRLGQQEARVDVEALLVEGTPARVRRLAALALAGSGHAAGSAVLVESALDATLSEPDRVASIRALGSLREASALPPLIGLLSDVRLRGEVASALGAIGGRAAVSALRKALAQEPYPEARTAEARALLALGQHSETGALVRKHLATVSGIPDGIALLRAAGQLPGFGLEPQRSPPARIGSFECNEHGCIPGEGARLVVPIKGGKRNASGATQLVLRATALGQPARLSLRIVATGDEASLPQGAQSGTVLPEPTELGFTVTAPRASQIELELHTSAPVSIDALVALPARSELPIPKPVEPEPDPVLPVP